jgi:shikimate dehydrogenase
MMRKFGLIGYPLGHSFSKGYFTDKFSKENIADAEYNNYPINSVNQLPVLVKDNPELVGLNVTIPYKEQVIEFLDELDPIAQRIGAVNTIRIARSGNNIYLKGFNTDYYGFEESLKPLLKENHKNALILGTGGASKAVAYVMERLGISYKYVSRYPTNSNILSYKDVDEKVIKEFPVIINTSPLGMAPNLNACPDLPYTKLTSNHLLYDLIYNPEMTLFLEKGKSKNCKIINGLPMLHLQAEKAWQIWNS